MRTKAMIMTFGGILVVMLAGYAPQTAAEVSVSIGIGVPVPQVVVAEPPAVVVIPGTYVYFAPDVGMDIFFYHGYWYRPHRGQWFRARAYDGPWHGIEGRRVPHVVRSLPPDFRYSIGQHERIRHVDLQRNWKAWEHEKHWDRPDYRHEVRGGRDVGRWEPNHGRPDTRHEVRELRVDRVRKGDQLRLGVGGGPGEVKEVRDDRDHGKRENDQSRPEGKGKRDR